MDIITQGLFGAVVAQAGAKNNETRLATLIGFCAPLLADADALIRSAEDPLLFLEHHRHFTHALLFIPAGALLAALLLWPFLKKRLAFKRICFYALIAYATSGFLDACTSYGTHLLWPFSDARTAWSIISIFDPLFSLALIGGIVFAVLKKQPLAARGALLFAALYLSLGIIQHQRAEDVAQTEARQRGHNVEHLIVKPTIGNLLLWRSVYTSDDFYYVDAVRVGLPGNNTVFKGNKIQAFDLRRDLPQLSEQTVLYRDIRRFESFSDGFLVWHPQRLDVIGDVRFAMLPTSIRPLWGIELNPDKPNEHVRFETYRSLTAEERQAFIDMLLD